jgi:hypothetical protein
VNSVQIEDGAALVWFAYDLGQQIDLDRAQQLFTSGAEREQIRHQRRAPAYLQFHPAPLRLDEPALPIAVGAFATDSLVECTLFDFGAVSIAYRIPIAGHRLDELLPLATSIDENPTLMRDSRQRVTALIGRLAGAIRAPGLADLVEDFAVFHVRRWSPADDPKEIVDRDPALIARILRSEAQPMRGQEVQDAMQFRSSYGLQDELVIDWNGAFLFDARGEDTLAVLEFANVELLEMRFLDDRLDNALDRSHDVLLTRSGVRSDWRLQHVRDSLRRISRLQIENAILFESVNNAIKMIGDQFLARVYRMTARRLHLDEWDASILRKLETLESIYEKLKDETTTRRMELLEWIIIALFLISIALPFLSGVGH